MNNRKAGHKVTETPSGYNVKMPFMGYTISLASDGEDTVVFKDGVTVFTVVGTGAEQICKCMDFIKGAK